MKKFLSIVLAALLLLSAAAFAEEDLQAQLDEANAKIAELQALVDKYEPYYTSNLAATWGEDSIIWAKDILDQYDSTAEMYSQYGIDLVAYGMDVDMKKELLNSAVQEAIMLQKAAELGLDQLTDEQVAEAQANADDTINYYIGNYTDYFYPDEEVTDEMRQEALDYWTEQGLNADDLLESNKKEVILANVKSYMTQDVAVTEDDVTAAYEALVASNQEDYTANPSNFVSDYSAGTTIAWNPEGHRAVKQILIQFDDDQSSRYSDLTSQLSDLQDELAALDSTDAAAEDTAADDAAAADAEATAEPTAEPRTADEINADIESVNAQIDDLYEELMPEVNEVVEAFNAGTSIDELIEKYNDDPGMTSEPTATKGYAVAADSTNWDSSFTQAAMSIANKGEISEPARGSYGIYIVYYMDDITPGEVGIDAIHDDLQTSALEQKQDSVYNETLEQWVNDANITYYYESLGITETEDNTTADAEASAETEAEDNAQ